jgi:methyl-galactoside transport system substrate-binding protein
VVKDKMKMKKIRMGILTGALISGLLLFSGCSSQPQNRSFRVGVVLYDQSDAFVSEVVSAYRNEIEKKQDVNKKIRLRIRNADLSQRKENTQVGELLEEGCDLLCVNLVERTEPSAVIHAAMEKDVPVIFFNREPVWEDLARWSKLYYIGTDARQSGERQGKMAADMFRSNPEMDKNHDGKLQYVILEGEPGHQDAIIRTDQVVITLQEQGIPLDKVSCQVANWSRAQAETRMSQLMAKYGNGIEAVLANNDDMALGAVDAYNKQNTAEAERPVILGIDGTKEGLAGVRSNKIAGTVYSNTDVYAEKMADMTKRILKNESLKPLHLKDRKLSLQYEEVTKENVDETAG